MSKLNYFYRGMKTYSTQLHLVAAEILFTYESSRTYVWIFVRCLEIEVGVQNDLEIRKQWNNISQYVYLKNGFKNRTD